MSQLEKVLRPKRVDLAVIRSHFRFDNGTEVININASVSELAIKGADTRQFRPLGQSRFAHND